MSPRLLNRLTSDGVLLTIAATARIPLAGPFISIGLGIAIWGDELIYDNIDY